MSGRQFKHLILKERLMIERGLEHGDTRKGIAERLGKDKSSISKEISLHMKIVPVSRMHECAESLWCRGRKSHDRCDSCQSFKKYVCARRDRSPGVCNGCANLKFCKREKHLYSAEKAQKEYESSLVQKRRGVNLTEEEFGAQKAIIVPLLRQGQSPYVISCNPKVTVSEKTIYNWIHAGYFSPDFLDIDLPRKAGRRISKKKALVYRKRKDRKYLIGRKYEDYLAYMAANPEASVMYMDTVYNNGSTGPFVQTMRFKDIGFFMAMYHTKKTSQDMLDGLLRLEEVLGRDLFERYAAVILTDRGSEFVQAAEIELRPDGSRRCHVFYCDPMASGQKGALEQIHTVLRFFLPKKKDLYKLGLDSQEALNLVVSHMDSYVYKALKGKSPIQMAMFYWPDLMPKLEAFGIRNIPLDDVTLNPSILKAIKQVVDKEATLEELEDIMSS